MNVQNPRETGSVLVFAIVLSGLSLAFAGGLTLMSLTNANAVTERTDDRIAFYLAEAGLEAGKREIAGLEDLAGDGVGTVFETKTVGNFEVFAIDFGDGQYQLTSTGTASNSHGITLQEIVVLELDTTFPDGAISIVGQVDKEKVELKKNYNLILDGGDSPAIAFSDDGLEDKFAKAIIDAIEKDDIPEENISGSSKKKKGKDSSGTDYVHDDGDFDANGDSTEHAYVTKDGEEGFLPLGDELVEDEALENLGAFYDDLLAGAQAKSAEAQLIGEVFGKGSDVFTYGTADNPVIIQFDDKVELKGDDQITGYGTLIVSDEFKLREDSVLNWVGDIIVLTDDKKKAKLEIDGQFNVDGNVVVLGEGEESAEFKIKDDAAATINGSLFIGTSIDQEKAKKVKFEVDGALTVNGMVTAMGSKLELKLKDDADMVINGTLQIALGDGEAGKDELKIKLDGSLEVHRDQDLIAQGASALKDLGVDLGVGLGNLGTIVKGGSVSTQFWGQVYEKSTGYAGGTQESGTSGP